MTATTTRAATTMTDPVDQRLLDRRRALQNRTGSTARNRRRHPALGARIAAAGMSSAAMLGIVAALGAQQPPPASAVEAPAAEPPSVIVVDPRLSASKAVTVSRLSDEPIYLTATPVVRAAEPAPASPAAAPVARTNGSR